MRFTISSAELKEQLQVVSGAIGNNPVLPILEDFLFKIVGDTLIIAATDLETYITSELTISSDEDGSVAIPAKILVDTLKQLPTQPLTFSVNLETFAVTIQSASGRYELAGENGQDFPKMPVPEETKEADMAAALMLEGINKTLFATSNDDLRPAMTGVYFQLQPQSITFVATDAHKLVKYTFNDIPSEVNASFIVPKKALNLLKNALGNQTGNVQITYNRNNAFFYFGNQVLVCRLIDANYPDYKAVIPTKNPNTLSIVRTDLLSALKRMANFANKTTNQVKLSLADGSLTIEAEDMDFSNKGTEQLPCHYEGTDMTIGFNAKFLIEMLNTLSGESVRLELSTPNRAGILRPEDREANEDLLMLVMPVMLNN